MDKNYTGIIKNMNYLVKIENLDSAISLLDEMSESLRSLSAGSDYRRTMAEKFLKYGTILAIQKDSCYIGFSAFYANDTENHTAFLSMIAVKKDYRGLSIGKELLDKTIEASKRNNMKKLKLEVLKDNIKAIRFYQNNGFEICSETENSFFMIKDIISEKTE